jgi:hypothetical protein
LYVISNFGPVQQKLNRFTQLASPLAGCGVHLRHLVDAPLDDDDLDVDMTGQVEQELEDKQSIGA